MTSPSTRARRRRTDSRSREVATVMTMATPSIVIPTASVQSAVGAAIRKTTAMNISASTAG